MYNDSYGLIEKSDYFEKEKYIENAYSIRLMEDNGFIAAGYTTAYGAGNADFLILKMNKYGNIPNSSMAIHKCGVVVEDYLPDIVEIKAEFQDNDGGVSQSNAVVIDTDCMVTDL